MTTGTISSDTMVGREQMIVLSGKSIRKKRRVKSKKEFGHFLRMVTQHMESPIYWIWLMFPMRLTEPYKAPWSLAIY